MVKKMSEERINPLQNNIRAARTIVDTVKSTLGPMGRDKMMVDAGGDTIITNDGATILRELDVSHPGAKMMVDIAKTQEALCYDGTTSTVILAGQLLADSENLFNKGLHPNLVCKGYNQAAMMAVDYLDNQLSFSANKKELLQIAETAVTGKTLEAAIDQVAALCVEAVNVAGSADKVKVVGLAGGSLGDSYFFNGIVVNKDFVYEVSEEKLDNVILLNTGLEPRKTEENVTVQLDMQGYNQFKSSDKDDLLDQAKRISNMLPNGGVVFIRDGVDDNVAAYLAKQNVAIVRRVPESSMKGLSLALNARISQSPNDIENLISGKIERKIFNEINYLFVNGTVKSNQSTLVLRGATSSTLDEVARGFDDALGVVSLVMNGGNIVTGGGSTYASIANHLRTKANTVEGRAQMAINAFADSLEILPATIAENAGHDPLDVILDMRHAISDGEYHMGVNVEDGGIIDMLEAGVVEPSDLVRQAILSATEVTTAILKIDDIIAKRGIN